MAGKAPWSAPTRAILKVIEGLNPLGRVWSTASFQGSNERDSTLKKSRKGPGKLSHGKHGPQISDNRRLELQLIDPVASAAGARPYLEDRNPSQQQRHDQNQIAPDRV